MPAPFYKGSKRAPGRGDRQGQILTRRDSRCYDGGNSERSHRITDDRALLYTTVSHFPEKGGDADGTRAPGEGPAVCDMLYPDPCDHDHHIPKSVLAVRRPPNG